MLKYLVIFEEYPYDPFINVALDESLLLAIEMRLISIPILRIWRNNKSVVIGRNTNVVNEVRIDKLKRYGIPLIRRISGGGAVYHDLGNYNYTLVIPTESRLSIDYVYGHLLKGILLALNTLGIEAWIENDTDVIANGFKVSGNSAIVKKNVALLHGTLLVNTDLNILCQVLKPNVNLVRKRGYTLTKYRVANLNYLVGKELKPEIIISSLIDSFSKVLGAEPIITMCSDTILEIAEILSKYRYRDPNWNWYKCENFNIWKRVLKIIENSKRDKQGICNLLRT